jgi:hypothetical protein
MRTASPSTALKATPTVEKHGKQQSAHDLVRSHSAEVRTAGLPAALGRRRQMLATWVVAGDDRYLTEIRRVKLH